MSWRPTAYARRTSCTQSSEAAPVQPPDRRTSVTNSSATHEPSFRTERDPLGSKEVPSSALYGIQTLRALENFRVSGVRIHPSLITAYAEVKKAAALANIDTGGLELTTGKAIVAAADEVIAGQW